MAADYENLYNWLFEGRPSGQEPKVKRSTKDDPYGNNNLKETLPWNDKQVVLDFLGELQYNGFPDWNTWSWEDISKILDNLADQLGVPFNTKSDGFTVANQLGIINDTTNKLTSESWDELWQQASQEDKANIVWNYIIFYIFRPGYKSEYYSQPGFFEIKTYINLSQDDLVGEKNFKFNTQSHILIFNSFKTKINTIFFDSELVNVNVSDPQALESFRQSLGANELDRNKKLTELSNKKLKEAKVLADLTEEPEEGATDTEQRKEFFKKIEQCILLNIVDKLGKYRKDIRSETIENKFFPYGGRIICIDVEENMYSNYSNSDGNTYHYTLNAIDKIIKGVEYKFLISKVMTVKVDKDNTKEIEMPLLFDSATNPIYNIDGNPAAYEFEQIKNFGKKDATLTTKDIIGMDPSMINQAIDFQDLTIKFNGENQATAKSNVDVDLKIKLSNISLLQAEFSSNTFYIDKDGNKINHPYTYSLVDLISYLHRTDLGDVYKNLSYGGSRLYNPKFFRNYNRLVLKILPKIKEGSIEFAGFTKNDEIYKTVKKYIENNPLILDLSLIDHTIGKDAETLQTNLSISYKGYIKSFLQNPKFDIIRSPAEIKKLIEEEKRFIKDLTPKSDKDAIKEIKLFNKKLKDDTQALVRKPSFLTELIARNRLYSYEIDVSDFNTSISKDFELLPINTISNNFKNSNISEINQVSPMEDEINTKLKKTGTYKLKYYYLGDLIDSFMDNIYYYDREKDSAHDVIREAHKDFNIRIILPSFKPLTTDNSTGERKRSSEPISVADIPISHEWFVNWYLEEFVESETEFYTIGTLVNRLISEVASGFLMDDCYLQGSEERKMFATRAEFGLFNPDTLPAANVIGKNESRDIFINRILYGSLGKKAGGPKNTSFIQLKKSDAPFFKKDPAIPRIDHCNYLYVYPQHAVFSDYDGITPDKPAWEKYNIPMLVPNMQSTLTDTSAFTKSLTFNKEEANYRRESRFQTENLYTLAQLASVYNVSAETLPVLDIFPGMLVWVNPGMYHSPSIKYSIANILGMGGFHIVESVTHTGNINKNTISGFKTSITANWISNGTINNKFDETKPEDTKEEPPEAPNEAPVPRPTSTGESQSTTAEEPQVAAVPEETTMQNQQQTNTTKITSAKILKRELTEGTRKYYKIGKDDGSYYHVLVDTDNSVKRLTKLEFDTAGVGAKDVPVESYRYIETLLKEAGFN